MRYYLRDVGQLVFLDCFGNLVNLVGDILWCWSAIGEIVFDSKVGVGA
jgi:hypothetical protein